MKKNNFKIKNEKKISSFLIIISLIIFTNIFLVNAIGVSPNKITLESIPGEYAEQNFLISNSEPSKYIIKIEGEHREWYSIEKSTQEKTTQNLVKLKVNIPKDAAITNYKTNLVIYKNNSENKIEIKNTNDVNPNQLIANSNAFNLFLNLPIELHVSGDVNVDCVAGGLIIPDFEEEENFYSEITIKNTGNSRIKPQGSVIISDEFNEEIYFGTFEGEEILPYNNKEIPIKINSNFKEGIYNINIYLSECDVELKKTFKVFEKNSLKENLEVINFESSNKITNEDVGSIKAKIKNIGERPITAKLVGTITNSENKIISVINSDEIELLRGETQTIEDYLNLKKPGKYLFEGKIVYENDQSRDFEQTIIIEKKSLIENYSSISLIIIISIIFVILTMIIKNKINNNN